MEKIAAVILMAGLSSRFGGETNKQLCQLKGKPVFSYSLDTFAAHKNINQLIIVVNKNNQEIIEKYTKSMGIPAYFVLGGQTRQESVEHALKEISPETDLVIIHDGARPLVEEKQILDVEKEARKYGASSTYIKSSDTIAKIDKDEMVDCFISRDEIVQIQTPQAFKFNLLVKAHKESLDKSATDDCSLLLSLGEKVKLVQGSKKLHKITTKEDLIYLESII